MTKIEKNETEKDEELLNEELFSAISDMYKERERSSSIVVPLIINMLFYIIIVAGILWLFPAYIAENNQNTIKEQQTTIDKK